MHRIDGPGATVDNRFTDGDPVGGIQATVVTDDWANDVQEELMSLLTAAGISPVKGTQNQVLSALRALSTGVIGTLRNVKMALPAAAASATFTADQIVVGTSLGGSTYRLNNFNKTLNLASSGAGGMDVGAAPVSGFVSIYAIYNPTTQTSALLACNQTTSNGQVYTGANMPAGYTASALVSAWGTTAAGLLAAGLQINRKINVALALINSSSVNQANTSISIAAVVPIAAKEISGILQVGSSAASNCTISLSGTAGNVGYQSLGASVGAGLVVQGAYSGISIGTAQTIFFTANAAAGALSSSAYATSYSI